MMTTLKGITVSVKITEYKFPLGLNTVCAVISDLHDEENLHIIKSLEKKRPDLIFLVGDIVNRASVELTDSTISFLRQCISVAPTYYSFGNHERMLLDSDVQTIKSCGVHVLDNTWENLDECLIGGLSSDSRGEINDCDRIAFRNNTILRRSMFNYEKRKHFANDVNTKLVHHYERPELGWLSDFVAQKKTKILLCHHPEYYDRYLKDMTIDLIIAGHAHGGQIRLFGRGLYSPGQGWFPRYTSGIYDGKLVVSRGLANTMMNVPRLFNSKELIYIYL